MLSRRSVLLLTLALGPGLLAFSAVPAAAADPISVEAAPGGPILGSTPATVTLQLSPEAARAIRKLPDKATEGPAVRLSIQGVKAPAGTSIHVFVNLPGATADATVNDAHYVGNINSFEDPAPGSAGDDVLFDSGPALRRLKKAERLLPGDTLAVTLVVLPGSAPADASIPVDKVVLSITPQGR
ncbi:MAG TPA: hypothetical protein VKK31_06960 [Thermoanaerobaculia bacterium]|nr:hypothetical protein [Thermoanaerobaculia bacterium]